MRSNAIGNNVDISWDSKQLLIDTKEDNRATFVTIFPNGGVFSPENYRTLRDLLIGHINRSKENLKPVVIDFSNVKSLGEEGAGLFQELSNYKGWFIITGHNTKYLSGAPFWEKRFNLASTEKELQFYVDVLTKEFKQSKH